MTGTFADPDVDTNIVQLIQRIIKDEEPVYPWTVLEQMEEEGVEKSEGRKALRKLRLSNHVVPAPDFKGKVRLAEEFEEE